jgi:nitrilase
MESQTFALHTGTVISARGVELNEAEASGVMSVPGGGSSIVYGPDGTALTEDLPATEEGLIYCDLKMDDCIIAKGMIDSIGHYSRPDILSLTVNTETMEHVHYLPKGPIVTVDKD